MKTELNQETENAEGKAEDNPVLHCLSFLGGKWKPAILYIIAGGIDRFGVMQRALPAINKQMLTKQLRELEEDGLLDRKIFAEIPPRVEYSITKRGRSFLGVIAAMKDWGETDIKARKLEEKARNQLDLPF